MYAHSYLVGTRLIFDGVRCQTHLIIEQCSYCKHRKLLEKQHSPCHLDGNGCHSQDDYDSNDEINDLSDSDERLVIENFYVCRKCRASGKV